MARNFLKDKKIYLIFLLLAVLTFFYFSDIIFSDKVFSFRDLSRYYYPLREFAFQQIKQGSFPFWNPYIASGHPLFAALQSVVLYPVSIVYLLPDFDFSFNLFIILHIFLGGVFFYILMLDLKFRHLSALISALSFMFGGYLISVINLTTTLAAAIWFPLVFLFYNRALKEKKFSYLVLSSLFLGLMFLGGEPTPLYATVFILGLNSLIECFSLSKKSLKPVLLFASFILIFLLLFSFQIIPFAELLKLSHRTQTSFGANIYWSFPPRDIVNFILPFFYGPLHLLEDTPLRQDWLLISYLGIIPLVLFFISLFFRKDEYSNFFKLTFLLGLIFIFGRFTPIYKLLFRVLPGMGFLRYPVKFFFLNAIAFSFLAGSGWEEYCARLKKRNSPFFTFIKALFICAFFASIIFLLLFIFREKLYIWFTDYNELVFSINLYNLRRTLVFFILGSLTLFFGAKKKAGLSFLGLFLIILIFIDLYGAKNIEINPAISRSILHKESPNILLLEKDKSLFRIYTSNQMNRANDFLFGGNTYEQAFTNSIDRLACNRLMQFQIFDARGYLSIHNLNYSKVLQIADTAPRPSSTNVLNMLNVKYILAPEKIKDSRVRLLRESNHSYLYENRDVLPRAYLVPDYILIKDEMKIAERLKSKKFKPQREVILEESLLDARPVRKSSISNGARCSMPDARKSKKKEYIDIISYKPNDVIIEANVLKKPKFLVLADNYYPGWKVFVDGKLDKIYKANFTLRGIYLAPGEHTIKFVFDSLSFKIGCLISLLTLISLSVIIIKLR